MNYKIQASINRESYSLYLNQILVHLEMVCNLFSSQGETVGLPKGLHVETYSNTDLGLKTFE